MRKGWVLLLLISLGLNLGLGARMIRLGQPTSTMQAGDARFFGRNGPRWERPAPGDTTAWRQFMGHRIDQLAFRLNLRPEQVKALKGAQLKSGRLLRQKRFDLFQTRTRIQALMASDRVDRRDVHQKMAEMALKQAEMDSLAAESLLDELDILDPAQRTLYLDFASEGSGRLKGRGRRGRALLGE